MTIKSKTMSSLLIAILFFSVLISAAYYQTERIRSLGDLDQKLLRWALYAKDTLPGDFHDRITDSSSIPEEEYDRIVGLNNLRCRVMGLQYLWSVLVLDPETVVFTTATSPGYDIEEQDHAGFFELHSDPGAFSGALDTMAPHFSSFHNEWGHGRMVLVPGRDARGRVFMFGASVNMDDLFVKRRRTALIAVAVSLAILLMGALYSFFISEFISRPIARLSRAAHDITAGNYDGAVDIRGSSELESLSDDMNRMSRTIKQNMEELEKHREYLEELVEERGRELREANEKLARAEKFAALGKLAGMVGHEIRNPLGVIRNCVYFLKMKFPAEMRDRKIDKHLRILEEEVDISDRIVSDILTYGRIKEPEMSEVDLNGVIIKMIKKAKIPENITVNNVPAPGLPPIMADKNQLEHLFINIISNAVAAMPERGVLTVKTEAGDGEARVSIGDTGVGISPDDLPRIFDPDFSSRPYGQGTGLGLAICHAIVNLHNGRREAESELGKGTVMTVILPFRG